MRNSSFLQSGVLDDNNVPPLDKIPTNEFIEKFLEDEEDEMPSRKGTMCSETGTKPAPQVCMGNIDFKPPPISSSSALQNKKESVSRDDSTKSKKGKSKLDKAAEEDEDNLDLETVLDVKGSNNMLLNICYYI